MLPGGHAPGMRQYLGSPELREKVAEFWSTGRPVGAICHGVLTMTARGTATDDSPAFVVVDGSYVSARWPGDAYLFANRFLARLASGTES